MIVAIMLCVICVGIFKKNIVSSYISLALLIWIIFLVPHDIYMNNDYEAYLYAFENPNSVDMESGFIWLLRTFSDFGFSFDQTRWTFLIIVTFIFWYGFRKISKDWSLVLVGYFFSTFFIDQVQLRNTIMFGIVFIGLALLLKTGPTKKSSIFFILMVILAGSVQISGFLYIFILLFCKFYMSNPKKIGTESSSFLVAVKTFFSTLLIFFAAHYTMAPILNRVQSILPVHFVQGYLQSDAKGGGQVTGHELYVYSIQLAVIITVLVILIREYKIKSQIQNSSLSLAVLTGIEKFNYLLVLLISVNFNFFRLLRNEWILILILMALLSKEHKRSYLSLSTFVGIIGIGAMGLWWSSKLVYSNLILPTVTSIISYL